MSESRDDGIKDLYDSEKKQLREIATILQRKHSFKGVLTIDQEEAIMRVFETEARNRCAEIGLQIAVQWDPDVSDDPDDNALYWNPRIIVHGRTQKLEEIDHDRMKHEIQHGVLDGVEGVIDVNTGQLGEPKKKDIY